MKGGTSAGWRKLRIHGWFHGQKGRIVVCGDAGVCLRGFVVRRRNALSAARSPGLGTDAVLGTMKAGARN